MHLDSYSKTKFLISLLEKKGWSFSKRHSGSHWRRYIKEMTSFDGSVVNRSYAIGPRTVRRELRTGKKWYVLESRYISKMDIYDIIALPM